MQACPEVGQMTICQLKTGREKHEVWLKLAAVAEDDVVLFKADDLRKRLDFSSLDQIAGPATLHADIIRSSPISFHPEFEAFEPRKDAKKKPPPDWSGAVLDRAAVRQGDPESSIGEFDHDLSRGETFADHQDGSVLFAQQRRNPVRV